jgi:hypothetical protein
MILACGKEHKRDGYYKGNHIDLYTDRKPNKKTNNETARREKQQLKLKENNLFRKMWALKRFHSRLRTSGKNWHEDFKVEINNIKIFSFVKVDNSRLCMTVQAVI